MEQEHHLASPASSPDPWNRPQSLEWEVCLLLVGPFRRHVFGIMVANGRDKYKELPRGRFHGPKPPVCSQASQKVPENGRILSEKVPSSLL